MSLLTELLMRNVDRLNFEINKLLGSSRAGHRSNADGYLRHKIQRVAEQILIYLRK